MLPPLSYFKGRNMAEGKKSIDQVIGKRPNGENNDENQSPYPGGGDPYAGK